MKNYSWKDLLFLFAIVMFFGTGIGISILLLKAMVLGLIQMWNEPTMPTKIIAILAIHIIVAVPIFKRYYDMR